MAPETGQTSRKRMAMGKRGEKKKCQAHFPWSSPCWNPPSFHLTTTPAMNYAWGVFEMCQEPTPSLLRCRGRLIVMLASEVVDYEEERCPCTTFLFFFFLFLSHPFCLSLCSSVISVMSLPPHSPQLQFRSLSRSLNPLFSFTPLNGWGRAGEKAG